MRAVNRFPFHKVEFVPSLLTPITGQIIRWNAHQSSIAAKITRPLLHVVQPDEWSSMRRASFAADSWLVGEQASESEWWDWWE